MFPRITHQSAAQQLKLPEHYDIIAASTMGYHIADASDVTSSIRQARRDNIDLNDEFDVNDLEDHIMSCSRTIELPTGWFIVGMGDPSKDWKGNRQLSWGLVDLSQCGGLHPDADVEETPMAANARRYLQLRNADIDAIQKGGVFAGLTPDNKVLNGSDLDRALDAVRDQEMQS